MGLFLLADQTSLESYTGTLEQCWGALGGNKALWSTTCKDGNRPGIEKTLQSHSWRWGEHKKRETPSEEGAENQPAG